MLCELHIQDIVLIDQLRLSVGGGLTALTGETGAGKSILLDSLGLATGARADKGLVRYSADKGIVAATFDVSAEHPAWEALEQNGLSTEDDTMTLRRVQMADGKSRAFINDQAVSVALLRQIGETLIEVHGQHQSLGFLNPETHGQLLDQYGGLTEEAAEVARLWSEVREIERTLEEAKAERARLAGETDYLRHVAEELTALGPEPGEEATLADRRAVLMAAEKVAGDLRDATEVLEDDGATRRLAHAAMQIERAAARLPEGEAGPLTEAVARLDAAMEEFGAARDAVVAAADSFVTDAEDLNRTEERLFALRAAGRKYSRIPDRLADYLQEVTAALASIEEGEENFGKLEADLRAARRKFDKAASLLSERRRQASDRLDRAIEKELKPLKLGHARFHAEVDPRPDEPSARGIDRIRFLVSTNPGTPFGDLSVIASGGELSRFVLALKAVLVARESRTVIIFDEVDSGVGGAVADAVGERLEAISRGSQVLVVTHSPQVAARGAVHLKVEKKGRQRLTTTVTRLDDEARTEEIARMLSGAKITDEARAAAAKLLAGKPKRRAA
ncbi:DNA repair protein RecN [Parvularcula marina]|uniref:DNA repair protein RecN n=1 Tax=Parvularcula marina TaxID=2292771 RepID=A0A371R7Y7_9PROT|nr:DNA repair protein RecN [Parvularcula marina]RFB01555.1 DNA repair protein RecN [Parvularcula marina]